MQLQRKADGRIQHSDGDTPLHLASQTGRTSVARSFEHGVEGISRDFKGSTPLHRALETTFQIGSGIGTEYIAGLLSDMVHGSNLAVIVELILLLSTH
ncbi:hypothetical protein BC826DRAFT_1022199 [Russula brevipes]|nr:hypothetical protein BC826DRAFT_1022199 [Russula brevipes]